MDHVDLPVYHLYSLLLAYFDNCLQASVVVNGPLFRNRVVNALLEWCAKTVLISAKQISSLSPQQSLPLPLAFTSLAPLPPPTGPGNYPC